MTLARRLLAVVRWHAAPRQTVRQGEGMARIHLYSTSGRRVMGVPRKRPSGARNALGLDPEGDSECLTV